MFYELLKKVIRSISTKSFYKLLTKYYYKIFFPKEILNISMLKHNEEIFKQLKFNLNNLKIILSDSGIKYKDCSIITCLQVSMIFLSKKI